MGWFKPGDTVPGFSFVFSGWLFDIRQPLCSLGQHGEWKAAGVIGAVRATRFINIANISFSTTCICEVQAG